LIIVVVVSAVVVVVCVNFVVWFLDHFKLYENSTKRILSNVGVFVLRKVEEK